MCKSSSPPPHVFCQNTMSFPATGWLGTHGMWLGLMVEAGEDHEGLGDGTSQVRLLSWPCSLANGLAWLEHITGEDKQWQK